MNNGVASAGVRVLCFDDEAKKVDSRRRSEKIGLRP